MKPSDVVYLDSYRGKKEVRFRRAVALCGHDPEKARLLLHLWDILSLIGADRGAVVWMDEYGPGLAHAHALLDLASDRPRRIFSTAPLKGAWDAGIPGLLDLSDAHGRLGAGGEAVRSSCTVALGSDGPRSWFLIADSLTPRRPLSAPVTGDLMFLAGELASLVLHRDLDAQTFLPNKPRSATGDPGLQERFAGWPVLQDIEGRRRDEEASRRIATRFLVARVVRGLLDDHLVVDPESLGYQVNGVRQEMDAVGESDPERLLWERILAAIELMNQDELLAAALEWGDLVENQGHLSGAIEIHTMAYELAAAVASVESAVDAARFRGRALRKLARWDEALEWYQIARRLAEEEGTTRKLASVLDGLGNTYRDKGNLPRAREIFLGVMGLGREHDDRYSTAIAHHSLMTVEKLAGNLDEAVVHGWRAVHEFDSPEWSLRALFDLAGVLRESGELPAAWDAYSVVAAQVEGSEYFLLALDALAYIAALRGDEEAHDTIRGRMDAQGWEEGSAPVFLAQMLYYRGLSARALGREPEARGWLERALACAEEYRLSKLIFDAEKALAADPEPGESPAAAPETIQSHLQDPGGEEILGIRQGLRELRLSFVGAGGASVF